MQSRRESWMVVQADSKDIQGRSLGLPEISGVHADHQPHRGPVDVPGYPQSSVTMADKGKTAASPPFPNRIANPLGCDP